ncbi:uncharacterized protein LOC129570296 [Sitodiplosis mosellana]|uniref:uncharacterized protein LOC129570296 n=1 Tax=Sitodiplosis mosellana TaxID=263140 RepID=UPI00244441A7|nr:uncharacterized protein LOC129570296 [Sitodiplosis mosellana]
MEELLNKMPNIRTIKVEWRDLLPNKDALLNTNVKLDNLIVETFDDDDGSVCAILNELYDRGFYKRLHLIDVGSIHFANQQFIDRMATLRALETLKIEYMDADFPVMPNVKKIIFNDENDFNFTTFPSKLPNLQWIVVPNDSIDAWEAILPFIRGSKQLSRINMVERTNEEYDENILDLPTLNKEREKLAGARKVIIYVPEETFLETKFAHGASYSLIEMKRNESLKLRYDDFWYID